MCRSQLLGLLFAVAASLPVSSAAHRPTLDQNFDSAESAYAVEDPEVSIVVYKEVTCDSPELWLSFEAKQGFPLYMQLGVPSIYRLSDYLPRLVLLHAGLPQLDEELPFTIPEGMGGLVMDPDGTNEPADFYEPFTGTESWIWVEQTLQLPTSGQGYLVAYDPRGWTGKLWVALGTVEDFSNVSPAMFGEWMREVNAFHETGIFEEPPLEQEQVCDASLPEAAATTEPGCNLSAANGSRSPAVLLGLMILMRSRRRRR